MSSKKIVLIIFVFLVLFVVFLNITLKKIQTVNLNIKVGKEINISDNLITIVDKYQQYKDISFIGNTTLKDISIQVLFIEHQNKEAVLVTNEDYVPVDYEELDTKTIYCNDYFVYISNNPTLIINCDSILGDVVERAITLCYQQSFSCIDVLDPENIDYFETLEEDIEERFYRHQMINSLKNSYFEDANLDMFSFYYHKWTYHVGKGYLEVVDYDYYDGLKTYIELMVKKELYDNFNLEQYVKSLKNDYSIYDKSTEYRLMGLLLCLVMEKQENDIFVQDAIRNDRYKVLLDGTPVGSFDERKEKDDFFKRYQLYLSDLKKVVEDCEDNNKDIIPSELKLTCELYSKTIQLDDNRYIYFNYIARDESANTLRKDIIMVKMKPYKIQYYIN